MSFPAYPVYKDSGVDWLGEIPEGWSIKPLWALFRRHKLTGFPDEQLLSVYRDYGVIPKASRDDNFNKPSDDLGAYQLVQVGDLAINKMKAWQGSVGISSHKGIVSPAYHVYAPSHSEAPQYLHHLFRCNEYIAGYLANSKGIRVNQWDLEPQQHSRMSVLLPSFQEQIQIARFLDNETARIDALIEEQQRLIDLLKEKRQAVISQAVTKGLDPKVPMKNSCAEWLGEVPVHWAVRRIKHLTEVISKGTTPTTIGEDFQDEGIRFLKAENIFGGHVLPDPEFFISERAHAALVRSALAENDVLVVIAGATTGKSAVLSGDLLPANTNQAVSFIRLRDTRLSEFIQCWLSTDAVQRSISLNSVQSAQPNLSMEDLGEIPVPLPPIDEIDLITDYMATQISIFEGLISEAVNSSGLLQERRSALISAAVTGKIDVRGWKPPANALTPELVQEAV